MKLQWEDSYSVGVKVIDDQHKKMFETINKLIDALATVPTKAQVDEIIADLILYKKFHFETEEKYFGEFNYENREEHKLKHQEFNVKLDELVLKNGNDSITLAFELVNFLEDWLINHLMTEDQKYVECFAKNGLK
ncbi:MAG: bacteriohemerythrin [Candidatus Shapirobacteria bacterium]